MVFLLVSQRSLRQLQYTRRLCLLKETKDHAFLARSLKITIFTDSIPYLQVIWWKGAMYTGVIKIDLRMSKHNWTRVTCTGIKIDNISVLCTRYVQSINAHILARDAGNAFVVNGLVCCYFSAQSRIRHLCSAWLFVFSGNLIEHTKRTSPSNVVWLVSRNGDNFPH